MKRFDDFMCTCDDDSREVAEGVLEDVKKQLDTDNLLSAVVYGLQWRLGHNDDEKVYGEITGMYADQWAGVAACAYILNEEIGKFEKDCEVFVQCDNVEHGLARAWQILAEEYGSR